MARRHFAKGLVAKPDVPLDLWMEELRRNGDTIIPQNQINRIAKTVLRKADPKQFLLSHATIVASVDTYAPKNVKLGKQFNRGVQIDVRYPEFRIKPETHSIINNNCFPAGVMILMADGTEKPIEEIKVDDKVISHTGIIRDVVRTFKNPHNGPVYTVRRRGDSRKLTMTGEHPVHMIRPKRNGAKTTFDDTKPFEWVSAGLLQKYDLIYTPRSVSVTATDMSPGKAKLIGYFLAEGYYYKQAPARVSQNFRDAFPGENSIPCSVVFALNKDETETLAADIVSLLRQEFGVEALIAPHRQSENAITVISTRSLELVQFFLKHVGQKAKEKKLSIECMQLDPELQKLILQGWIEGDGTVKATLTGWISATTSSVALASQMVVLFNRCGVPTSRFMRVTKGRKRVKTADGNWMIETDETKSCTSHIVTVNSVDSTRLMSGSWLEAIHQSASARLKKHNFLKFRVQPDKMLHQVLGIKKESFSGLVYNFETEIDHSYVANGVAVHNCDSWDRPLLLSTYRTFIGAQHYCFVPDTKVLMADGTLKNIQDISVGEEVIGGSGLPKKVVHKHVRDYEGEVKLIYTGHNKQPIVCTPNHPFARLDRRDCIQCGVRLPCNSRPASYKQRINRTMCIECGRKHSRPDGYEPQPQRVRAEELENRAILFAPIPNIKKNTIEERDSIRMSRLMGFYLAEGSLTKSNGNPTGVIFTVGTKETDLIQQILDCVRVVEPNARPVIEVSKHSEHCTRIKVYKASLARILNDRCGTMAYGKRLSTDWMNSAGPEEVKNLIGAYVSGDADVHKVTQRVRACSVSQDLLQQIQFLAASVRWSGFIVEHSVKLGDSNSVVFADGTVHEIISKHQAHILHFDVKSSKEICEFTTAHKKQLRSVAAGDLKFLDNKKITFVNKIETDSYSGSVFNLEVEEDHSYIINGTVQVFNCEHSQLPELSKGFIVDAIARDVGHSVYIDILVATDKKHEQLVSDILSGRLNSLSMGCFMPGTLVTLGDGTLIPIEEIKPDMEVISQKGNICKVNNLQIRTNRWSMRRVKAVGLPIIEATDNHKFYAAKSEDLQFRKSKGRKVLIEDSYKLNYVQAGDLKIGDVIATPIPTAVVEPTVTEAEARLLGLWVGDGWKIDNKHDRTRGIGLCINEKETDLIQEVEDIIGHSMWRSGELKQSVNGRPPVQTVVRKTARSAAYLLNHSSCIRSLVDDHTSGRTSAAKRINQSVMEWPESHQLAFLSGIVDSDGCVSTTKHGTSSVHISTRNSHLANQYMILLARCGMVSTLQKATRPGTKMLPNSAGVDYRIRIGNDQVHKIPSLKINKNKDKIRPSKNSSGRWIQDGYSYTRIKSVSSFDHQGWVYDLEVEKDHSYIANGYGVSNCTSQFTICTKCGNVAYDDASLCPCIAVDGKGSKFLDEDGVEHSIAELIGHVSVPNSNVFIEASWVHTPAFTGAVRRSILNEDEEKLVAMMASSKLTARPVDAGGSRKRASMIHMAKGDDLDKPAEEADPLDALKGLLPVGESGSPEDGDDTEPAPDSTSPDAVKIPPLSDESPADNSDEAAGSKPKAKTDKVDTVVNKIEDSIIDAVIKKVEDRFNPKPEDVGSVMVTNPSVDAGNDNLVTATMIANAVLADDVFDRDIKSIATRIISHGSRTASASKRVSTVSHKDMLILLWAMDKRKGREYPTSFYKVAMKVGSMANYPSRNAFLASVKMQLGCALTPSDIAFFTEKAELTSIAGF